MADVKVDIQQAGELIGLDINQIIIDAYAKLVQLEQSAKNLKRKFKNMRPKKKSGLIPKVTTILKWAALVQEAQQTVISASGLIQLPTTINLDKLVGKAEEIVQKAITIIVYKVQIVLYEIKKIILKLQRCIEVASKQCVVATLKSKTSPDPSIIAVSLACLQLIGTLILVIQTAITILCNLFVTPFRIPAGGLTFFLTPKSIVSTELNIANPWQLSLDNLSEPVKKVIDTAIMTVETANNAIRVANIALGAANAAAVVATGSPLVDKINFCPNLNIIDANKIFQAVNAILNIQIFPLPVPRFEKLKITNLGYLAWLITGYEPGAKTTFGIPGMP